MKGKKKSTTCLWNKYYSMGSSGVILDAHRYEESHGCTSGVQTPAYLYPKLANIQVPKMGEIISSKLYSFISPPSRHGAILTVELHQYISTSGFWSIFCRTWSSFFYEFECHSTILIEEVECLNLNTKKTLSFQNSLFFISFYSHSSFFLMNTVYQSFYESKSTTNYFSHPFIYKLWSLVANYLYWFGLQMLLF